MSTVESDEAIRLQLDRISTSATFQQVDRLKRFLEFVVSETVAGRGTQLKEYVLGIQVFDKDNSFDPRTDPVVRVQARRLRARLAKYYEDEGSHDAIVIEMPKGGYAPVFKKAEPPVPTHSVTRVLASRNTITVAPFSDQSSSGDLDYFCRGLCQEIVHTLTSCQNVRVLVWDAPPANTGSSLNLREIANRLDAAMVVNGSIRRIGSVMRVSAQIVDGSSGAYVWSDSMDGDPEDMFGLQEKVAASVLRRLNTAFGDGSKERSGFPRPIENLAARNLCLQGRYHLNQRSEESLRKAAEFFERALIEDGQYALAFSGLADAYGLLGHYGVLAPAQVWTKTASSAASAVMLGENLAEAHASLAHVKSTQDWDWAGAEQEYQRAIRLDTRYATAHHWYAVTCLGPMARLDEALEEIGIAQALDPISSIIARDHAMIHFFRRDFEAALDQIDHTVALNPYFSSAYWALGLIQEYRGELDESTAAFQRAIQLAPESPRMHAGLGRCLALSGKRRQALRILQELRQLAENRYVSSLELASMSFALGEMEEGYVLLTKAFQDRCFELLSIMVDPRFDYLRKDRQFQELSGQLGLGPASAVPRATSR
jgi:TolB-like protein/Flp pilus assembly protein TadD